MPDRTTLTRLGKLVVADVTAGRPGPNSQAVSHFLEAQPEAVLELIDMLVAEAGRKRRNEKLVTAYAFMIGQALEVTRYGVEGGYADAAKLVDAVRQRLLAFGKDGQFEPALLLMVLRAFASAKLDPGPELRELMERLAEGVAASMPAPDGMVALDSHLEDLASEVGGDPFELYTQVREMADAFPENHRAAMGSRLLQSREEAAREAALGWLLDESPSVRTRLPPGLSAQRRWTAYRA